MNKLKAGDTSAHAGVVFASERVGLARDTRHDGASGRKCAVGSLYVGWFSFRRFGWLVCKPSGICLLEFLGKRLL